MPKIKLLISYDGTDFCGWQKQKLTSTRKVDAPSVQATLESALAKIFNEKISATASGRTDAGVHALAQVVHFSTEKKTPKDLCWAVKRFLPSSIVIKQAWLAPDHFHATTSATHKTYRYWIWNHPRETALLGRYSWWVRRPLDINYLNEISRALVKTQDFKSFQSTGTPLPHTIRTIYHASWTQKNNSLLEFKITGSGFLKQMVRNIVGTEVDLFFKNQEVSSMERILKETDRTKAGVSAPPQGLFLSRVYYPPELDKMCSRI